MSIDDYTPNGDESKQRNRTAPKGSAEDGFTPSVCLASGIVVSSRVRLARNIADFPFLNTCSDHQRAEIESAVRNGVRRNDQLNGLNVIDANRLQTLERQFIMELQSVSGFVEGPLEVETGSAKDSNELESTGLPDGHESSSLLLNEDDHLRIQVHRNGLDLENAWQEASRLDDLIEQRLNYAFSPQWGYLTACPADVGTGLRASVLMHLPALVMTGKISKVLRKLKPLNVVGREMFGDPEGDFFRIANQATLGWDESELILQVELAVTSILQFEIDERDQLLAQQKEKLEYEIAVALEQLLCVDLAGVSEQNRLQNLRLLSRVRMGIGLGLLERSDANRIVAKFELIRLRNQLAAAVSREDYGRASQIRDRIHDLQGGSP